jgi:hypothetical protein
MKLSSHKFSQGQDCAAKKHQITYEKPRTSDDQNQTAEKDTGESEKKTIHKIFIRIYRKPVQVQRNPIEKASPAAGLEDESIR